MRMAKRLFVKPTKNKNTLETNLMKEVLIEVLKEKADKNIPLTNVGPTGASGSIPEGPPPLIPPRRPVHDKILESSLVDEANSQVTIRKKKIADLANILLELKTAQIEEPKIQFEPRTLFATYMKGGDHYFGGSV
eukprot:Platyproteum_vivax@DN16472_c0_g1_i1.p1